MSVVGHVQHRTDGLLRLGQGTGLKLDLCSRALCQTGSQKASPAGAAVGCLPHECDLEVSGLVFLLWFGLIWWRRIQIHPGLPLSPLSAPPANREALAEMCAASRSGEMLPAWCTDQGLSPRGYAISERSSLL